MEYKYVGVGKGIKKQAGNKNKNILYQFFKKKQVKIKTIEEESK